MPDPTPYPLLSPDTRYLLIEVREPQALYCAEPGDVLLCGQFLQVRTCEAKYTTWQVRTCEAKYTTWQDRWQNVWYYCNPPAEQKQLMEWGCEMLPFTASPGVRADITELPEDHRPAWYGRSEEEAVALVDAWIAEHVKPVLPSGWWPRKKKKGGSNLPIPAGNRE